MGVLRLFTNFIVSGRGTPPKSSVWALSAQSGFRVVRLTAARLSNRRCALRGQSERKAVLAAVCSYENPPAVNIYIMIAASYRQLLKGGKRDKDEALRLHQVRSCSLSGFFARVFLYWRTKNMEVFTHEKTVF